MEIRPFYELDDDEIVIEEAANAALSNAVRPLAATATVTPALPLQTMLSQAQATALVERFAHRKQLTLIDHAYLVNRLACVVSADRHDQFGFAAALQKESALLLLDSIRPLANSRSAHVAFPEAGVAKLMHTDLDYTGRALPGLSVRLERETISHFTASFARSTPFFALRRFSLALMPELTKATNLTDTIGKYTVSARIFINSAAAKQAIIPWERLALLSDATAERDAREVLNALYENIGVLDP